MLFSNSFQSQLLHPSSPELQPRECFCSSGCGKGFSDCTNTSTCPRGKVLTLLPVRFPELIRGENVFCGFSECLNTKAPLPNIHGARRLVGSSLVSPPVLLINPLYRCIDVSSLIFRTSQGSTLVAEVAHTLVFLEDNHQ